MAVPYGRKSRSRSRMQRAANMKYKGPNVQVCPSCGEPMVSHRVCPSCGKYRDRNVLEKKDV